ncbi:hypothetical protein H5410_040744 [Solanum commersonii]|uniref:Uncharacterized protein n=1 Tax=Solanum commersonii TaxID=4109 RepID=A0A9J5XTG0_SOLCO|nr:hypothetical protein H5410_040744 [Solanum commersonii]
MSKLKCSMGYHKGQDLMLRLNRGGKDMDVDRQLIVNEFQEFQMHYNLSLIVPSLLTEVCKLTEVEIFLGDNWMEPKNLIFSFKMHVRSWW